jgi:hypothetical protein
VPGPSFVFTGNVTTGFPDYRDTATGRMLVAEPRGCYGIEAVNLTDAVPPGVQWIPASGGYSDSGAPPPGPPPVTPVPEVPSVNGQEGGE